MWKADVPLKKECKTKHVVHDFKIMEYSSTCTPGNVKYYRGYCKRCGKVESGLVQNVTIEDVLWFLDRDIPVPIYKRKL